MKILSEKITSLPVSATLAMAAKARELRAKGIDVIGLSLGEPDFNTPDFIKKAAIKAIDENYNSYSPVDGYLDLKKSICEKFKRDNNIDYKDEFEKETLGVEILEIKVNMNNIQNSITGAVRKMSFFTTQYNSILKKLGKDDITEEEYEKEESRYHVMTCMKQALNAARARGGVIDEGNLIYLFDMGINSAQAQAEVYAYLEMENKLMAEGKAPTHEMTMQWLEACADKFSSDAEKFAERRGFKLYDEDSLNTKLLTGEKTNGKQDNQV